MGDGGQSGADQLASDGFSAFYTEESISEVRCLKWIFPAIEDSLSKAEKDKERARRRRIKDYVGSENLDVPMMDSKAGKHGPEICDLIIITEHLSAWELAMIDYFSQIGYEHDKKTFRTTGFQITWSKGGDPFVSVNLYPNKSKFMVQPGARESDRLLEWISHYDAIRQRLQVDNGPEEDPTTTATVQPTAPPCENSIQLNVQPTPTAPPLTDGQDVAACCLCTKPYTREDTLLTCPDCRQMGARVGNLVQTVNGLSDLMRSVVDRNDKANDEQKATLITLNAQLVEDNNRLRKSVTELTQKLNKLSWTSFKNTDKRDLLIGSSIIRDVTKDKLTSTDVICKPGGTIDVAKQEIDDLNKAYDNITVVVGGNDCDARPPVAASRILESYYELIDSACQKSDSVTISSICPRMKSDVTRDTINAVNAGLLATCSDKERVTFVDSTSSFMLGDGSINDGYLLADGVHITKPAMNKLAKNLKLKMKSNVEGVCKNNPFPQHKQPNKTVKQSSTVPHDEEGWTVVRRNHGGRYDSHQHDSRCGYCGESGHQQNKCRHGQPVECHSCHRTGHKSKFCRSTY